MDYRLISSDSHVTMPDEAWQEYLDPEFRDRAPVVEETDEGVFRIFEGRRTAINTLNNLAGKKPEEYTLNVRKLSEPRPGPGTRPSDQGHGHRRRRRRGALRRRPARRPGTRPCGSTASGATTAGCRTSPRYAPDRLLGMAAIPIDTPELAVAEIHFAAAQPGLAGGYIPLFPSDGDYGDPKWNPMWEAFLDTGLPIGLHVGGRRPGTPVGRPLRERPAVHDRTGHEQADDGRGRLRADPRPGHAALPGPEVHRGRGPDRLDLVLPVLLRPPLGEAPVLDEERADRSHRATTSAGRCSPRSWRTRSACASATTSASTTSCGPATTRTRRPRGRTRRASPTNGSRPTATRTKPRSSGRTAPVSSS